jgi:hypothetical protein
MCSYLGVQDAARKRRKTSQTLGSWAGAVMSTDGTGVSVSVSKEKWKKAKGLIKATKEEMEDNGGRLSRKELERQRGFLLYMSLGLNH